MGRKQESDWSRGKTGHRGQKIWGLSRCGSFFPRPDRTVLRHFQSVRQPFQAAIFCKIYKINKNYSEQHRVSVGFSTYLKAMVSCTVIHPITIRKLEAINIEHSAVQWGGGCKRLCKEDECCLLSQQYEGVSHPQLSFIQHSVLLSSFPTKQKLPDTPQRAALSCARAFAMLPWKRSHGIAHYRNSHLDIVSEQLSGEDFNPDVKKNGAIVLRSNFPT